MRNKFRILPVIAVLFSEIMLSSCGRDLTISISEFYIDKQFCKEHLIPEKLYRIDTRDDMDALFPNQALYSLENIDFAKHTVLLVYGIVPGNYTQNVELKKKQSNEYALQIRISLGIATAVASSTWSVACITNTKLSDEDNVTLDLLISNSGKIHE